MSTPEDLDRLILEVPGVTALYPPDPAWHRLAAGIADALAGPDQQAGASAAPGAGTEAAGVHVRIGVDDSSPAPETARRVAAAIRQELAPGPPRTPGTALQVTVQISLITPCTGTPAGTGQYPDRGGNGARR